MTLLCRRSLIFLFFLTCCLHWKSDYKLLTENVFIFLFFLLQTDPLQGLIHYLQSFGNKDRKLNKVRKTMVRHILFSGW